MSEERDYDVVIDTLQKHKDILWKMTRSNKDKLMKYYTIVFPGEFGQHVQETWSADQIIKCYYTYWATKILENNPTIPLDTQLCIEDWVTTHWGEETDEFGNKQQKEQQ